MNTRRAFFRQAGVATALALLASAPALTAAQSNAPPAMVASPAIPAPVAAGHLHHLTPIEYFRGLLAMNPAERTRELSTKPAAERAVLLAKIREYEALPREVREARLCQTELHWELLNLMKLPPPLRAARLLEVAPPYLPMIQDLLREWDRVPAATQKALLEQQSFIGVYLRMQGRSEAAQKDILDGLPAAQRARWTAEMDRWQALPRAQRADLCAQFQRFCQMSGADRQETVHALSPAERAEMEETLQAYDKLLPQQREMCINSFRKFATMAPEERAEFLQNAARWDAMTPDERQLWREMVHTLPPMPPMPPAVLRNLPPMPPGFPEGHPPPLPPMPPNVTTPVVVAGAPRT